MRLSEELNNYEKKIIRAAKELQERSVLILKVITKRQAEKGAGERKL